MESDDDYGYRKSINGVEKIIGKKITNCEFYSEDMRGAEELLITLEDGTAIWISPQEGICVNIDVEGKSEWIDDSLRNHS